MNALFALRIVLDFRSSAIGFSRYFQSDDLNVNTFFSMYNFTISAGVVSDFIRNQGKNFPETYQKQWAVLGGISAGLKVWIFVNEQNQITLRTAQKVARLWSVLIDALAVSLYFIPKSSLKEGLQMVYLSAWVIEKLKEPAY